MRIKKRFFVGRKVRPAAVHAILQFIHSQNAFRDIGGIGPEIRMQECVERLRVLAATKIERAEFAKDLLASRGAFISWGTRPYEQVAPQSDLGFVIGLPGDQWKMFWKTGQY